jgi:hypothetical protein
VRALHHQDADRGPKSCAKRYRRAAGRSPGTDRLGKRIYQRERRRQRRSAEGSYADGGGEADTPQHCDGCGQFLQNPLTGDGRTYVEGAIRHCITTRKLSAATNNAVVDWAEFYKDELDFRRIVLKTLKSDHPEPLCHGNSIEHALRAKARQGSCRCDGILPLRSSFGSEDPQCGSGDEVALKVEGVVNRAVHVEETLGGSD